MIQAKPIPASWLACFLGLLIAMPAFAGVSKLSSPSVKQGLLEVEYAGTRYGDDKAAQNNEQSHAFEVEYGFTDRLKLGLELGMTRDSADGSRVSAYGIEGQYAFTRQGDWWLDSALKAEYSHAAHDEDSNEAAAKLLLGRSFGDTKLVMNAGLGKEIGDHADGGLEVSAKLQASHRITPYFAPGAEWHGDFGELNRFGESSQQEHYLGPVILGDLLTSGNSGVKYSAGYFWGMGEKASDNAARVHLSYQVAL